MAKNPPANAGDVGLIPESGRFPEERNGNSLQYSCLGNSMDRAWQAAVHGKTIALTRWPFVDKVMSLLFNMQSMLVIDFLPRSKRPLISWLQSPSAVILEPKKITSVIVSPSICHGVMTYRWRASL